MKFFGIEMEGGFYLEILDTLPTFEGAFEGRLVYVNDTQTFYYGGITEWKVPGFRAVATYQDIVDGVNDDKFISPLKLNLAKASSAEVITGTDNTKYISPLALRGLKASIAESEAGLDDIKYVTPAGLAAWTVVNPGVISGTVLYFASSSVPTGYLKCNGAAVSRTTYSTLFAAIGTTFGVGNGSTTFNLPDLRGEFIRGWDDGRGVDVGRVFGSFQADENKEHTHDLWGNDRDSNSPQLLAPGLWRDDAEFLADDPGTIKPSGGTESRPRNIALLACIKY